MSFFTKAVCHALQQFPAVNAYIDPEKAECSITIIVTSRLWYLRLKALVVPAIRNAESLSMWEIEKEVKRLAIAGRDGKLSMGDMEGGTFSITNGGVFGSLMSTPILNPPQSAILEVAKIEERPVAIDGKVEIRPMMYLLCRDHRIIDGKEFKPHSSCSEGYARKSRKTLIGN